MNSSLAVQKEVRINDSGGWFTRTADDGCQ